MKQLERNDVERILRDVLSAHGLHAWIVQIDRTGAGWRRSTTIDVASGFSRTSNVRLKAAATHIENASLAENAMNERDGDRSFADR